MNLPERKIHLFEISIPKIEVLGFKVGDVQDKSKENRWFNHRGIWFDAEDERTERYTLYEIPFLSSRCKNIRIFNSKEEVKSFLKPYEIIQLQKNRLRWNIQIYLEVNFF